MSTEPQRSSLEPSIDRYGVQYIIANIALCLKPNSFVDLFGGVLMRLRMLAEAEKINAKISLLSLLTYLAGKIESATSHEGDIVVSEIL